MLRDQNTRIVRL